MTLKKNTENVGVPIQMCNLLGHDLVAHIYLISHIKCLYLVKSSYIK